MIDIQHSFHTPFTCFSLDYFFLPRMQKNDDNINKSFIFYKPLIAVLFFYIKKVDGLII